MPTMPVSVSPLPSQPADATAQGGSAGASGAGETNGAETPFGGALQAAMAGQGRGKGAQAKGDVDLRDLLAEGGLPTAAQGASGEEKTEAPAAVDPGALAAMLMQAAGVPVTAQPVQKAEVAPRELQATDLLREVGLRQAGEPGKELPLAAAEIAVDDKALPHRGARLSEVEEKASAPDFHRVLERAELPRTHDPKPAEAHAVPAPVQMHVTQEVGSRGWDAAVGQKVVWMASEKQQVAELQLNPPNLGPLEVKLTITGDQTSAMFVSHSPAVREAIETALPRLRDMLADNGIMLGNVTVGAESFARQQDPRQESGGGRGRGSGDGEAFADVRVERAQGWIRMGQDGAVDTFA